MAARPDMKDLFEDPLRWRNPAPDATKELRLCAAQPNKFRGPERRPQHAAGPLLDFPFVEIFAQSRGIMGAARIGPGINRGERFSLPIEPDQAVPKTRPANDAGWMVR